MQKFIFSLESLLKVKKIKKKNLEKDMVTIAKRLEEEHNLLSKMELERVSVQQKIEKISEQGTKVSDLREYGYYLKLISENTKEQIKKCDQIQEEWESIKSKLIDIHNQIDVLERLKYEQYKEYIYELQKNEEKTLEDIVNFKIITRSEHIYG